MTQAGASGRLITDRLEQFRLRRRLAQLQASSALRLCTGRQAQRSTTGTLLELSRAPRHAWTPARAGGWQRVARSLSPAQRSAAATRRWTAALFLKSEREKVRIGKAIVRTVMWCLRHAGALAWRRGSVCACTRVCLCRQIFTINQSIKSPQSRTRAQSHTRARRSQSQRHLKGSKPRVAKQRRLGGLKAPTLTEARVEANGEYRVKLAERNYKAQVVSRSPK